MTFERKLKREEERMATLEFFCGMNAALIGKRLGVSESTIKKNVIQFYSRALNDPLIEYYRYPYHPYLSPLIKEKNAAHFYLSFQGRPLSRSELVQRDDATLQEVYQHVRKHVMIPHLRCIVKGLEEFFQPSNGYDMLMQDIFEDAYSLLFAESLFAEHLTHAYQTMASFQRSMIKKVENDSCKALIEQIKAGALAWTPEKKTVVYNALTTLLPRESKIIQKRYGLQEEKAFTLEEVSKQFCVERERIRQIESKALQKLRHSKPLKALRSFFATRSVSEGKVEEHREKTSRFTTASIPVDELDLSVRATNMLYHAHLTKLGDIEKKTEEEMREYPLCGDKAIQEIKRKLAEYGIVWGDEGIEGGRAGLFNVLS